MFLDASVLIAALEDEPEAGDIQAALISAPKMATSPVAMFEASCRIARVRRISIIQAEEVVEEFIATMGADLIVIDAAVGKAAHGCASRYHHLAGHPARLNLGDCFAYAAAQTSGLKLAYKGNDFVHTDIDGIRFGA